MDDALPVIETTSDGWIDEDVVLTWMGPSSAGSPEIDWILEAWDPGSLPLDHEMIQSMGHQVLRLEGGRVLVALRSPGERWPEQSPNEFARLLLSADIGEFVHGRRLRVPVRDWTAPVDDRGVFPVVMAGLRDFLKETGVRPQLVRLAVPGQVAEEVLKLAEEMFSGLAEVRRGPEGAAASSAADDADPLDGKGLSVEGEAIAAADIDGPSIAGEQAGPPDIDALHRLEPDEARRIQEYLASRGYKVIVDGIMGPATYRDLYTLLREETGRPLTARNRRPALAKLFPDVGDAVLDALDNGVMRAGLRDKSSVGDMLTENDRRTAALEAAFGLPRDLASKIVVEAGLDRDRFSGAVATDVAARPDWPRTLETLLDQLGIEEDEAQEIAAVAEEMGHPLRAPRAGPTEVAGFYPDHPAIEDRLYGKAVASVLATTIARAWVQVHPEAEDKAFMAHLHGPWGSGKSSILRFLEEILAPRDAKERARKDYWDGVELERDFLVVKYNAWQHQDMGAPWFTLMNKVYQDACARFEKDGSAESRRRRREIIGRHWVWRLNTGWQPVLIGLGVTVATLVLFYAVLPAGDGFSDVLKGAGGVVTGLLTLFALKDKLGIVNTRTADTYLEQANNPLPRLTARYHEMINQIGRKVAVFVDDVDRCDAGFVVDLLHAIQTFYREAPVVYVVAGDRDWICSAYEQTYEKFRGAVAEPGHSMGHLFLEKLFQVSAEVPKLAPEMRRSFWDELIHRGRPEGTPEDPAPDPKDEQRRRAEIEGRVREELADAKSQADIRRVVMAHRSTPLEKAVSGALAFEKSFAPEIERERRHFLADYADRLEPNPRAMKRLLNAYGFRSAYDVQLMEQSRPDALVRWTIFENRWPVWAAEMVKVPAATADPEMLATCRAHVEVREVLAGVTWDDVRQIVGAPAGRGAALLLDEDAPAQASRDNGTLAEDARRGED